MINLVMLRNEIIMINIVLESSLVVQIFPTQCCYRQQVVRVIIHRATSLTTCTDRLIMFARWTQLALHSLDPVPKLHLDRFIRFCRNHHGVPLFQQTTEHATCEATGRIYALRVMQPNYVQAQTAYNDACKFRHLTVTINIVTAKSTNKWKCRKA